MGNDKHTQNWSVYDGGKSFRIVRSRFSGQSDDIASNVDSKANAHLIAAAPDLLEAAKQIAWKLSHGTKDNPNTITRLDATFKMLEAAIAKAQGAEHE